MWASILAALARPYLRHLAKPSLPRYQGEIALRGLAETVTVLWQRDGIPHVHAANELDLFFAQGYLHAQERLWQMDLNRRFLAGRLAEILGQFRVPWQELISALRERDSIDADYFMRLIGIRRAAVAATKALQSEDRDRLQAYADGVNRFIEQCGARLPLEFRLLRYAPDPWQPEDSLTVSKGFAFLLSLALFTRLNAMAVAAKLAREPEKFAELYPSLQDDSSTITQAVWDSARGLWRFTRRIAVAGDWHPAGHGSNAWVVAPSASASAGAILCNDPHMRLMLPSMWYLMHLRAENAQVANDEYEVWGASVPGCPGIQVGHNRWIAWGFTAALCDDVEIYRERIHPLDPDRYQRDGQWLLMERRRETIGVRRKNAVEKIVRFTCHGPVISDFNREAPAGEALSLRWTAHDPSEDFRGLYRLNRAHDWPEFLDALSLLSAPTLNVVYADNRGNIGYTLAGKVPVRSSAPSVLPRQGWHAEHDWRGFLSFGELPRLFNPPERSIVAANNQIVDSAFNRYLSYFFEPPYRARRIHELLRARPAFTADDMRAVQGDLVSLQALHLIAVLRPSLEKVQEEPLKSAADLLLRWNGDCGANSVEAAIFHVLQHHLSKGLLEPTLGEELFVTYVEVFNQSIEPIDRILRHPNSPWLAGRSIDALTRSALADACAELTSRFGPRIDRWHWGKLHTLRLNHAFHRLTLLRPFFSLGPFPTGGDNFTINLGFYRHSNPYAVTVGPSMRMIVETGSDLRSKFILPSGQSGHLFSRHFRDQTTRWLCQDYIALKSSDAQSDDMRPLLLTPCA